MPMHKVADVTADDYRTADALLAAASAMIATGMRALGRAAAARVSEAIAAGAALHLTVAIPSARIFAEIVTEAGERVPLFELGGDVDDPAPLAH